MRTVTINFLVRNGGKEVLLAMKKRGFGEGLWNGYGGKFDPEKDKDVLDAAVRECKEEGNVTIKSPKKVAEIEFTFTEKSEFDQIAHVYLIEEWDGEPEESEEMRPQWYRIEDIPYDKMWVDDILWLPRILKGETLKMKFVFKGDNEIVEQEIVPASYK